MHVRFAGVNMLHVSLRYDDVRTASAEQIYTSCMSEGCSTLMVLKDES